MKEKKKTLHGLGRIIPRGHNQLRDLLFRRRDTSKGGIRGVSSIREILTFGEAPTRSFRKFFKKLASRLLLRKVDRTL